MKTKLLNGFRGGCKSFNNSFHLYSKMYNAMDDHI